jgi:hypothetical protein
MLSRGNTSVVLAATTWSVFVERSSTKERYCQPPPKKKNLEMIGSTATCPAGCDQAGCMQNKSGNDDLKIFAPAYTT